MSVFFKCEISGACQIPPWHACPDLRHGRKAMMSWWGNLRKTHSFVWCWSRNTNSEKKHEQAWRTKHMVPLTLEHALTCILFQDSYWTLRSFFWVWGDVFFWFTDFPSDEVHQTHPLTSLTWVFWGAQRAFGKRGSACNAEWYYLNPWKFQNLDQDGKVGIQTRYDNVRKVLHPGIRSVS